LSSSALLLLRDIHSKLLTQYNCKEGCAPSPSQAHVGARGELSSQDGVSQQQEDAPLFVPQLNRLHEASIVRGEDASNVAVTAIPAQNRVTLQILSMWQPFVNLNLTFAVSRRVEQLRLRAQQRIVATAEEQQRTQRAQQQRTQRAQQRTQRAQQRVVAITSSSGN
jgi:hypothetical protein